MAEHQAAANWVTGEYLRLRNEDAAVKADARARTLENEFYRLTLTLR